LPYRSNTTKENCAGRPSMGRSICPSLGMIVSCVYTKAMYDFSTRRKKNCVISRACQGVVLAMRRQPDVPRSRRCTNPLDPSGFSNDSSLLTELCCSKMCSKLGGRCRLLGRSCVAVDAIGLDSTNPLGLLTIAKPSFSNNISNIWVVFVGLMIQ
jgi:hypothetical protein